MAWACICTLIKQANFNQSQRLLDWLANETTAVNHELNLSLTFGFEVQTSASKFTFQSKNKELKATCPIRSGRIGVQENMFFFNMTITKQRPRSLRLKLSKLLSWIWNEEQLYLRQQEDYPNWWQRWKNWNASTQSTGEDIRPSF